MPHSRWTSVAPSVDRRGLEIQLAYVDGYVLALEDALSDLHDTRAKWIKAWQDNGAIMVDPVVAVSMNVFLASLFKDIKRQMTASMEQAKTTRKTFKEIYHGDPQAALGDDVRGDLG